MANQYEPSAPAAQGRPQYQYPPPAPDSKHHHQHSSPWLQRPPQQQHQQAPAPAQQQQQPYQGYATLGHPAPVYPAPSDEERSREWMTDLCGCLMDPCTCLFTLVCPCIAFGRVAERLDDGATSCLTAALVWYVLQQFTTCGCVYSTAYRQKLRRKYNLRSRPLPDFLVHYFCWYCAICQETRELRYREEAGFNSYAASRLLPPPQQSFQVSAVLCCAMLLWRAAAMVVWNSFVVDSAKCPSICAHNSFVVGWCLVCEFCGHVALRPWIHSLGEDMLLDLVLMVFCLIIVQA